MEDNQNFLGSIMHYESFSVSYFSSNF